MLEKTGMEPNLRLFNGVFYLRERSEADDYFVFATNPGYRVLKYRQTIVNWKKKFVIVKSSNDWPIPIRCKKPTPHAVCDEPLTLTKREKSVLSRLFTKGKGDLPWYHQVITTIALEKYQIAKVPHPRGKMLEEVLKLLGKGGGRVVDGFQCLLATDAPSGSDCEVEKPLDFNVPDPSDPEDEEHMVSQERACDAHAREEQDRQTIASLRLKNKRLKRKFKMLKTDDNECHEVSTSAINQMAEELVNIKADVDMLTQENASLRSGMMN
ncbi:hypothetical protein Dimus_029211 [Dionaea muscipula]